MSKRKTITVSVLGSALDAPKGKDRWSTWRPTVAMCCHEELLVDELVLIHQKREKKLLASVVDDIASVSPETKIIPVQVDWRDAWDFEEVYEKLHGVARQLAFDPETSDLLVGITTGTHVAQICLYLLTESRHLPGRLIQLSPSKGKNKAAHIGTWRLIDLDLSKYDAIASRFELEQKESVSFLKSGIATRNKAFNSLIERIEKVAIASSHPMLLTGPTGAGKSQLAKRIYELKKLRNQVSGPLVSVNCATLMGDQAMSALFGHAKGAFTGAAAARDGLLRSADGGVLFLDEVGELGTDEQAMLLKAIEEKRFLPVGSDTEVGSDFQLIAGTNRDLRAAVATGKFREDLLARIDLWTFRMPGLAERREDIEANLVYELAEYASATGSKVCFTAKARKRFLDFAKSDQAKWKANFRDFNAAIVRMSTLADSGTIGDANVAEECERLTVSWADEGSSVAGASNAESESLLTDLLGEDWRERFDLFDQRQLVEVVEVCRSSRSLAAAGRKLFAVSREGKKKPNDSDRLRKYLSKFGITWKQLV